MVVLKIFSRSVADGLEFYRSRGVKSLTDCDGTIKFTLRLNNLFDALNKNHSRVGIRLGRTQDLDVSIIIIKLLLF